MRYLFIICLFVAFSCSNSGSKKSATEVKSAVQENIKTVAVEVSVKGMTCTGCEQTIQTGISSLKGVKQVKAKYQTGKAFVEFIPEIADTVQMKEKITAAGYVVAGIRSIPLDTLRSKL